MLRKIIKIDREKCNGCGLCVQACHEGAIGLESGKAKLLREDYCDGLGDCLPVCPMDAISFQTREAPAYDHQAVLAAKAQRQAEVPPAASALENFPVQIKLLPPNATCFADADLLIAADCTAYAYGSFHRDFMAGKVTMIGCPKLDGINYEPKLTQILENNPIRSITLVRMQVPCCGGLAFAVKNAISNCGKPIPYREIVIAPDGKIVQQS